MIEGNSLRCACNSIAEPVFGVKDNSSRLKSAPPHSPEADARLAAFLENSDDAIISKDLNGIITSWNRGAERIFGFTAKEAVGNPITMLKPPDAADDMPQIMDVVRHGGKVEHYETARLRKDGVAIIVSLTVMPVRDRDGRIVGASKIAREITGQKQVQQELRESEERFRATFEQAAVGIAHVDLDGHWLRVNRRLCDIVGYSRDELLSSYFSAITHPDDLAGDWQNVRALLSGALETFTMEKRYIRGDGRVVWANLTVSLVRGDTGDPKYFISVVEDISDRKTAEQAIIRQADLLEQALEPILAWELGGGITYWNRAAEELYGFTREEALGKCSHDLLKTVQPWEASEFEARLSQNGTWRGELTHTTKEGRVITVESRHKVVREDGRLLVLESNRDVTDRKRAEHQLSEINSTLERRVEERTRQLHQANKELEAFAYSVSHDLRSPLRSIDGFGQILLREYAGKVIDEAGARYIKKMSSAADRMANLIQDLLDLSRISRAELTKQQVNMSEVASLVMDDLRSHLPEREVDARIQDHLMVQADPRLLRVALDNLLGNAWKFTGKEPSPRIEFGAAEKEGETVYFVRDNGAGFAMEHAGNLFGPFQRLHRDSEFEGTGIGLAIVQRVIHKHGGFISAEAEEGRGATFYFTLG
jgi:PAS domain S-box-containing protein